jgi:hypothetical protein
MLPPSTKRSPNARCTTRHIKAAPVGAAHQPLLLPLHLHTLLPLLPLLLLL